MVQHVRTLSIFSCVSSVLSAHGFNVLTCFLDVGKVSCDRGCVTEPTLVLGKDTEGIGVANDEVGDNAAGSVITLQYCEPELWGPRRCERPGLCLAFGLFLF